MTSRSSELYVVKNYKRQGTPWPLDYIVDWPMRRFGCSRVKASKVTYLTWPLQFEGFKGKWLLNGKISKIPFENFRRDRFTRLGKFGESPLLGSWQSRTWYTGQKKASPESSEPPSPNFASTEPIAPETSWTLSLADLFTSAKLDPQCIGMPPLSNSTIKISVQELSRWQIRDGKNLGFLKKVFRF